jgi:MYXO-CTERM domain-containing protein
VTAGTPLRASLAVVVVLATVGSFGAAFGVMTGCTNEYSCTSTGCAPCTTTNAWLTAGWIAQGVLLLAGLGLAVLAARRTRLAAVRTAALLLGPLAFALFVLTTVVAAASY